MPPVMLAGHIAQVSVNGTLFEVRSGDYDKQRTLANTNTSFVGKNTRSQVDKQKLVANIVCQKRVEVSPHQAPYGIATDDDIELRIFERGIDAPNDEYNAYAPEFNITSCKSSWNAEQGIQELSFSGESSGDFWMPGEDQNQPNQ